jgi:hypothetical protein
MKLPSVALLVKGAWATFCRFPLAICFAILAAWAGVQDQRHDFYEIQGFDYLRLLEASVLGVLLSVIAVQLKEAKGKNKAFAVYAQLLALGLIILYYYFGYRSHQVATQIRFFVLYLGLHLLISVLPYMGIKQHNGFWYFNEHLFLNFLKSLLYSCLLSLGLTLALSALRYLLKVDINSNWYLNVWIIILVVFNTWFFLAQFPKDYAGLDKETGYPQGLKILTQYILLPMETIYLLILYVYMGKIMVGAQWPVGWVSYLILVYAVLGIFSLLLIHPIRDQEGNKWMREFSRFFYIALIPLLMMLYLAIFKRLNAYGVTELRYYVLLLGIWLGSISLYFVGSKIKSIKVIPVSLCILALLSTWGPWGAFQWSLKSQQSRLTAVFEKNHYLVNGKLSGNYGKPSSSDRTQMADITDYLIHTHGTQAVQRYLSISIDSVLSKNYTTYFKPSYYLFDTLKIPKARSEDSDSSFYWPLGGYADYSYDVKKVSGYDYFIPSFRLNMNKGEKDTTLIRLDTQHKLRLIYDNADLEISVEGESTQTIHFQDKLLPFLRENTYHPSITGPEWELGKADPWKYKLICRGINGDTSQQGFYVNNIEIEVLLGN